MNKTRMRANEARGQRVFSLRPPHYYVCSNEFHKLNVLQKAVKLQRLELIANFVEHIFPASFRLSSPARTAPSLELYASRERSIINGVKKARLGKYNATISLHRDISSKTNPKMDFSMVLSVKNECTRARDR